MFWGWLFWSHSLSNHSMCRKVPHMCSLATCCKDCVIEQGREIIWRLKATICQIKVAQTLDRMIDSYLVFLFEIIKCID
jgi:hypothetical protein